MSLDISAAPLGARNATLTDLAVLLREQQARKVDVVAVASAIRALHGRLVVDGTAPVLGEDGADVGRDGVVAAVPNTIAESRRAGMIVHVHFHGRKRQRGVGKFA